jgi:hypothetical protein
MTDPEELIRQIKEVDASVLVTMSTWAGLAKQIQEGDRCTACGADRPCNIFPCQSISSHAGATAGLDFSNALHWNRWLSQQETKSPMMDVQPEDMAVIISQAVPRDNPKA